MTGSTESAFTTLFGRPAKADKGSSSHRRTVVFIGNCMADAVATALGTSAIAARTLDIIIVPLQFKSIDDVTVRQAVSRAQTIFLQKIGTQHLDKLNALRRPDSEVVLLPNAILRSLWPFDRDSGFTDKVVLARSPDAPAYHHDGALAALREAEPDKKKRLQKYRDLDFALADRIDRVMVAQSKFFENIDRETGVGLGKFITENFRDMQLFYNTTHPSGLVHQEIAAYCWRRLELPGEPPIFPGTDGWRNYSVPVHPEIARRNGVKWADSDRLYHTDTWGRLTWEEWAQRYIDVYG